MFTFYNNKIDSRCVTALMMMMILWWRCCKKAYEYWWHLMYESTLRFHFLRLYFHSAFSSKCKNQSVEWIVFFVCILRFISLFLFIYIMWTRMQIWSHSSQCFACCQCWTQIVTVYIRLHCIYVDLNLNR